MLLLGALAVPAPVVGAEGFPDAAASDPKALGLMQGHPPPPDKRVMQPQSDFFSFPKMRWTVCHIRELMPTIEVDRGLGAPTALEYALDSGIGAVTFLPDGSDKPMIWTEALAVNYTDGMLVLHQGKVVFEHYAGCLDETGKHAAMSMTKSLTGLLAEILVAEGVLDDEALVSSVVPELADSAFGDANVRQVMDMTTGLAFSEDYSNSEADIWTYSAAADPMPKPSGSAGPVGYHAYLRTVRKQGEHGIAFGYKTVNSDALGWIIARTTGRSVADLLSERIWRRIGAEQDGYFTVDGIGTPFAGGGLSAGLRDLGRIGQLMLDNGQIGSDLMGRERIFPAEVTEAIRAGGDQTAFAKAGYKTLPGASYRGMWWVFHNAHGAYAARGVHGQTIYIDPTAEMVIVRLSSHPVAKNAVIDPTSLPAYQAVAEYLMAKRK